LVIPTIVIIVIVIIIIIIIKLNCTEDFVWVLTQRVVVVLLAFFTFDNGTARLSPNVGKETTTRRVTAQKGAVLGCSLNPTAILGNLETTDSVL